MAIYANGIKQTGGSSCDLPVGGLAGQILAKKSEIDGDLEWKDAESLKGEKGEAGEKGEKGDKGDGGDITIAPFHPLGLTKISEMRAIPESIPDIPRECFNNRYWALAYKAKADTFSLVASDTSELILKEQANDTIATLSEVSAEPNPVDDKPYYLQYTYNGSTMLFTFVSTSSALFNDRYINNYNKYLLTDGKWVIESENISSIGIDIRNRVLTNFCTNNSTLMNYTSSNTTFGALITGKILVVSAKDGSQVISYTYTSETWQSEEVLEVASLDDANGILQCNHIILNTIDGTCIYPQQELIQTTGTATEISTYKGKQGQIVINTDDNSIHVMDGVNNGGHKVKTVDMDYTDLATESKNVIGAINEVFQFANDTVNNMQEAYAQAIVGKGGEVAKAGEAYTKAEIVAGIESIEGESGIIAPAKAISFSDYGAKWETTSSTTINVEAKKNDIIIIAFTARSEATFGGEGYTLLTTYTMEEGEFVQTLYVYIKKVSENLSEAIQISQTDSVRLSTWYGVVENCQEVQLVNQSLLTSDSTGNVTYGFAGIENVLMISQQVYYLTDEVNAKETASIDIPHIRLHGTTTDANYQPRLQSHYFPFVANEQANIVARTPGNNFNIIELYLKPIANLGNDESAIELPYVSEMQSKYEEAIKSKGGTVTKVGEVATLEEILNGILSIPVGSISTTETFIDEIKDITLKEIDKSTISDTMPSLDSVPIERAIIDFI